MALLSMPASRINWAVLERPAGAPCCFSAADNVRDPAAPRLFLCHSISRIFRRSRSGVPFFCR
ncbi:hypothetical protein CJJ19_09465 [Candidatus Williamhamiltonella defendens]|nr:hypothetical protein CJJ19_09465 [Candidatus Hamiltonella defensa]